MKNIRTYEGFFDFFKKKNYVPISIRHILDCLLPITDCDSIKSTLKGDRPDGIFVDKSVIIKQSDHEKFMDYLLDDTFAMNIAGTGLEISGNIAYFRLQYSPINWTDRSGSNWNGISNDEVNSIMKECQETLEGFDCQMTFFIGRGGDEGRTWETEFSDINKMLEKTVKRMSYGKDCIRNITVKIKALGGIEA
jgi:hypothetical protein